MPAERIAAAGWESPGAEPDARSARSGRKRVTMFCSGLELPADFVPRCTDGEVEELRRMPIEVVAAVVRETRRFEPDCKPVVIDFLLRHRLLDRGPGERAAAAAGLWAARFR